MHQVHGTWMCDMQTIAVWPGASLLVGGACSKVTPPGPTQVLCVPAHMQLHLSVEQRTAVIVQYGAIYFALTLA